MREVQGRNAAGEGKADCYEDQIAMKPEGLICELRAVAGIPELLTELGTQSGTYARNQKAHSDELFS